MRTANGALTFKPMEASAESRDVHRHRLENRATHQAATTCWSAKCGSRPGSRTWSFPWRKRSKLLAGVRNEEQEIAAANYPLIRMFTGTCHQGLHAASNRSPAQWLVCAPEHGAGIFRRRLFLRAQSAEGTQRARRHHHRGVGREHRGGVDSREALAADPQLKPMLDRFDAQCESISRRAAGRGRAAAFRGRVRTEAPTPHGATNRARARRSRRRRPRDPVQDQHIATVLFNGMIASGHPLRDSRRALVSGRIHRLGHGGLNFIRAVQAR